MLKRERADILVFREQVGVLLDHVNIPVAQQLALVECISELTLEYANNFCLDIGDMAIDL